MDLVIICVLFVPILLIIGAIAIFILKNGIFDSSDDDNPPIH